MREFKLPSDTIREFVRHRCHTRIVTVYECQNCGEMYDYPPVKKKHGWVECPTCNADEHHFQKKRIVD
jgi:hypothetical protein